MIHHMISHNGRLLPIEQSRLSPGQEGLINGWGLFTTLRVFEGWPFAFERHWRRLRRDSERTHVPLPADGEPVRKSVYEVIRANQVSEGAVRIYVIWNRTGIWHSGESFAETDIVVTVAPLPKYPETVRLALGEHGRHAASPLAGTKVISWLNNVWHAHEAKRMGFDEIVLLNERGEVAECTAANIFAVHGGQVTTPQLDSGCLAGITREVLRELGPKSGIAVNEGVLRPDDLYAADEVFVSSTNRAVLGVAEIAGHKIAAAPGPVTQRLGDIFADYVAQCRTKEMNQKQASA